MNISLPADQIDFIDSLVSDLGYANRSELMRAIIRFLKREPKVVSRVEPLSLHSPVTKNGNEVLRAFCETGLYSKAFIKDLEEGINDSNYFSRTTPSQP